MSIEWSFGRIVLNKTGIPKFLMLNRDSEEFTIFAEPMIQLFSKQKEKIRIKKRDRKPEKAKAYPGEIYGELSHGKVDNRRCYQLSIYVGEGGRDIKLQKVKGKFELKNLVNQIEFIFPEEELENFVYCIKTMLKQHDEFNLLRNSYVLKETKK